MTIPTNIAGVMVALLANSRLIRSGKPGWRAPSASDAKFERLAKN